MEVKLLTGYQPIVLVDTDSVEAEKRYDQRREKCRGYRLKYYQKHREERLKYQREYYQKNREKIREKNHENYQKSREKITLMQLELDKLREKSETDEKALANPQPYQQMLERTFEMLIELEKQIPLEKENVKLKQELDQVRREKDEFEQLIKILKGIMEDSNDN